MRKVLKWSGLVGLLLGFDLYFVALYPRINFSEMSAYDNIYAGMTREEAVNVLTPALINCGLTQSATADICHFSDFWHIYEIDLDSQGRVFRKWRTTRKTRFY
jgi:hypothetical protein